ncbi:MAG: P22 phage major capsid protein family protein [Candidatus Paceibacterota bacterium]
MPPITMFGTTESAVFIPEVWSDGILDAVEANLVFANLVSRDYEGDISKFGDVVRIPNVSNLEAHDKVSGVSVTVQAPTETDKTITINKHKEVSFYVEDIAAIQSKANLREIYTNRAGYAIAKAMDSDLAALYAGLSQSAGSGGSAIDEDAILDAIEQLDDAEAPEANRSLVIRPSCKKAMLKIEPFIRASYIGPNGVALPSVTGKFGQIYGCDVFITTQIPVAATVAHNLCFHKEAFALAVQLSPRIQAQYEQKMLATLITVDVLYGVAELRDTFAVDLQSLQS